MIPHTMHARIHVDRQTDRHTHTHTHTANLHNSGINRRNVFRGLDSRTELLNNNPGIIHILQHWRHHYRATIADTDLPYK